MMQSINMLWTTLYSLLSGVNRFALSFDAVAQVVEVNATNFKEQELIEAKAKTQAIREKYKDVVPMEEAA